MAEDARDGVQFTLNGGWLGKTIAGLLAIWIVAVSSAVVQIMVTRYSSDDAQVMTSRVSALETLTTALSINQTANTVRLESIGSRVQEVASDTEWIRRRMEGAK